METIASLLHSSYAYLLVAQILLVAALSLVLLALVVKRIKVHVVGTEAVTSNAGLGEFKTKAETLETEKLELIKKISDLEAQMQDSGGGGDKAARALTEKVKFLEAKLLEYEILQEEIGSLSTLKVENEKLKETVMRLQKGDTVPTTVPVSQEAPQELEKLVGEVRKAATK